MGPRAFRPGEKLHGRGRETRDLTELLAAERIVLCHSPSGAGKTSLLQAQLVPALSSRFVIHGPARVSDPAAVGVLGANRYVLSVLMGMEAARIERLERAKRLERGQRLRRGKGIPRTRQPKKVERMHPDALAKLTLDEYLALRAEPSERQGIEGGASLTRPEVLIFDQFEEILTLSPDETEEKTEFFRQVGEALRAPRRRALFAIREDHVAGLDPYIQWIPTRLAVRYALGLLDAAGAREAIEEPAKAAGVPFTPEALDQLVDNLLRAPQPGSPEGVAGRYVEPVQLQVVCTRIWLNRPPNAKEIDKVGGVADVDTALAEYYAETVARVAGEKNASERRIRRWFDTALISGGVRAQVARGSEVAYGLNEDVVKGLVDAYLVRREERRTSLWYELAHDRLMMPVKNNNAKWFYERASHLQRQAELWAANERPEGMLFRGGALKDAQRGAAKHPDETTPEIEAFLTASVLAQRTVQVRVVGVLIGLVMALLIALGVATWQWYRAQKAVRDLAARNLVLESYARQNKIQPEGDSLVQAVENSLRADSALEASQVQGDTMQRNLNIWYFRKTSDPQVETLLRELRVPVTVYDGKNRVQTNFLFYGDSVRAGSLRLLALSLLRANIPLRGMCPLNHQSGRERLVQVLGVTDMDVIPVVTLDQVAGITDASKRINCVPPAAVPALIVFLQFYSGDNETSDRRRMRQVQQGLRVAGFYAPGVDSVSTERANEVRFTDPADRPLADSVGRVTARLLGRPAGAVPARVSRYRIPRGRVEVWLDLSASSVRQN